MKTIMAMLEKFRKDMDFEKRQEFVYSFFPFMFGIYPYTVVTKKQKEAMKLAGVDYTYSSLYNLTFVAVRRMLRNKKGNLKNKIIRDKYRNVLT